MLRGFFWTLLASFLMWVAFIAALANYFKPEPHPPIPPIASVPMPTPRPTRVDQQTSYCAEYRWQLVRKNPMMPPIPMHLPTARFLKCTDLDPASSYRNGTET